MAERHRLELPIAGMDCADCARAVQRAVAAVPGVVAAEVRFASNQAIVWLDAGASPAAVYGAVEAAGYRVPLEPGPAGRAGLPLPASRAFTRRVLTLFGVVFASVLFVVVVGERLGLFESLSRRVPWPAGAALVLLFGYPVFRNVLRAARRGRVIAHTLMTVGVLAALAVGEWATAAVVVFFMRVGDYAERFTTERARRAVGSLARLRPQTARLERAGEEREVPLAEVHPGDIVVVRPGEKIPVDGEVVSGHASVDQATITGEPLPLDAGPGARVFAATFAQRGSLRVRTTRVGDDTTFGRVVRMVEEAEAHRAGVQRLADRFSGYYLPVVAAIAALTYALRRDAMATAAVLVVACACAFALATPIAMLASVGAAARRGLLIKGGKYLEALARADVLLIDKTGTLTLGRPRITDIVPLNGMTEREVLELAATAERYSEHPLAEAVRAAARERAITPGEPEGFEAIPGAGVRVRLNGSSVTVGSSAVLPAASLPGDLTGWPSHLHELEAQGKTLLFVARDEEPAGVLAAADTLRPEVPRALAALRALGIARFELLTGDTAQAAQELAGLLGIPCRARLLPEDKIEVVRQYQSRGHTVVMVGDGVNDAPALAQADAGIAMGAAGSDVALEAAHVALLRDDWMLVPHAIRIARRTMRVVKGNIAFTACYNMAGLTLAAFGWLPPVFAAAAQSLPDLGILANSSRLLRQK